MSLFSLFFLVTTCTLSYTTSTGTTAATTTTTAAHNRRTLHQPFFPQDTPITTHPKPSTAPSPPSTTIPFTPAVVALPPPNPQPFFQSLPSPPPPPPPPSASFPANISALNLPTSPKPRPISSKLIATAVALTISAAIVISIVAVLRIRKQRRYHQNFRSLSDQKKTHKANNGKKAIFSTYASHGRDGGNRIPKLTRPSQSSTEFLYIGTLFSSHGGIDASKTSPHENPAAEDSDFQKLGSPELRPLPPLAGGYACVSQTIHRNAYGNANIELPSLSNSPTPARPPPPPLPEKRETPSPATPVPVSIRPVTMNGDLPLISSITSPENQENVKRNQENQKPKLKALHWDKVRADSDREMVWDQLKSSSFQVNEDMIETLFTVKTPNSSENRPITGQENRVLDPKKSQNIAISLRALNMTIKQVTDALLEGNVDALGTDLLECLIKMAPTKDEERKLKDSSVKLGPAETFLGAILDVPFAFKRIEAMLYVSNFDAEVEHLKRSFGTLEAACDELRNSRMFLRLLEAVLKSGNRMNLGTNLGDANAFNLDTLLKLADVRASDGQTTLLHFVVQEIARTETAHISTATTATTTAAANDTRLGLRVVSGLVSGLPNVKRAAAVDTEALHEELSRLSEGVANVAELVGSEASGFSVSMNGFLKTAEAEIVKVRAHEGVALSRVRAITEYFHGDSTAAEKARPFRIFTVVRDFLTVLDRVCRELGAVNERTVVSSARNFPVPLNPTGFYR